MSICVHCKGDTAIRNPSGFCDHLYYPENCQICKLRISLESHPVKDGDKPHCVTCGSKKVTHGDFTDMLSRKEYHNSGMCQKCQDDIFNDDDL